MPAPRSGNQWPNAGELKTKCLLQYGTETRDAQGGLTDATFTQFAEWMTKVTEEALIQDETKAPMLFHVEGWYRRDLDDYFNGVNVPTGATTGVVIRIVTPNRTLKVIQIENPLHCNRTLIAHCAKVAANA